MTDHERELANLREQVAALEDTVARQALLLVRKSEALSVFADEKFWDGTPLWWVWNGDGGGAYRDPIAFAQREAAADEPTD